MSVPLVIGYGNTLRGDDGAGVRAAELVRDRVEGVDVLTIHELQPDLAETVAGRDTVIFLDADAGAGTLVCVRLEPGTATEEPLRSHLLTPPQVLALCRILYGRAPGEAWLVGIPAEDFAFRETLSGRTAASLDACIVLVDGLLHRVSPPRP
jgi:hydrogenase maturation protease